MNWLDGLMQQLEAGHETPGPEWRTTRQPAEERGISESRMRVITPQLIRQGLVKMKKFRAAGPMGGPYLSPHYAPVR